MRRSTGVDRDIELRAMEWGYRTVLVALCAWTLANMCQSLANHTRLDMLPCLILCLTLCMQTLSQWAMRRKALAEGDKAHEPEKPVPAPILCVAIVSLILSIGVLLLMGA